MENLGYFLDTFLQSSLEVHTYMIQIYIYIWFGRGWWLFTHIWKMGACHQRLSARFSAFLRWLTSIVIRWPGKGSTVAVRQVLKVLHGKCVCCFFSQGKHGKTLGKAGKSEKTKQKKWFIMVYHHVPHDNVHTYHKYLISAGSCSPSFRHSSAAQLPSHGSDWSLWLL